MGCCGRLKWNWRRGAGLGDLSRSWDLGGELLSVASRVWGLKIDHQRRLKGLERENARLKRAVAELTLDKQVLKGQTHRV